MKKFKLMIVFIGMIFGNSLFALAYASDFQDHFDLVRDQNGNIIEVRSVAIEKLIRNKTFSFSDYALNKIDEFEAVAQCEGKFVKGNYIAEAGKYTNKMWKKKGPIVKSFVSQTLATKLFLQLDENLRSSLTFDISTLARPLNPGFYIKKDLFKTISKGMVSLIKAVLPFGELASFLEELVTRFLSNFEHHRGYDRYKLVHFLLDYSPEELGMSAQERNYVLSSLAEWNVGLIGIFALKKIKRTWSTFGRNLWGDKVEDSLKRIKKNKKYLKKLGQNRAPFFYDGTSRKNNFGVMNFLNKRGLFEKKPSWAYRPDKPWAILAERSAYDLLYLAMNFNPYGWINTPIKFYLNIRFAKQRVTEGSLWLSADLNGDDTMKQWLEYQTLNPLLITKSPSLYHGSSIKHLLCP